MCEQCKNVVLISTQRTHDKVICCEYTWRLKTPNTEPDICDLWHAKSNYFRSTDTLRLQWPFPLQTGRRCFTLAVEYLNPIKIDHVTLRWAADNRCARAHESVCLWSCSKPCKFCFQWRRYSSGSFWSLWKWHLHQSWRTKASSEYYWVSSGYLSLKRAITS